MNENALSEASVVIRFAWTKGFSGLEADQKLTVDDGQVVEFAWQGNHNVYLLRDQAAFGSFGTSSCDWTGAQLIDGGASSGVRYTFSGTGRTLHFGCKVGTDCQMGQKLIAVSDAIPTFDPVFSGHAHENYDTYADEDYSHNQPHPERSNTVSIST